MTAAVLLAHAECRPIRRRWTATFRVASQQPMHTSQLAPVRSDTSRGTGAGHRNSHAGELVWTASTIKLAMVVDLLTRQRRGTVSLTPGPVSRCCGTR
jgi:hypothetical protein